MCGVRVCVVCGVYHNTHSFTAVERERARGVRLIFSDGCRMEMVHDVQYP